MGFGNAPATPDYAGAAEATAAGDLEVARATAAANRVNQITPYGTLTYTQEGDDPDAGWIATQALSDAGQQQLDLTNELALGLLGTAGEGLGYVDEALATGGTLDESLLAQAPIQGIEVQDAILERLQPQLERNRASLQNQLSNRGLMMGSEAYENAMEAQGQLENDLYTQAALQGIDSAMQARQQGILEQYTAQDRPLNIVNALRSGNQVQLPQFTNVPQQATTRGPDLLGAAAAQYNAQLQNAALGQSGLGTFLSPLAMLGGAYFMGRP